MTDPAVTLTDFLLAIECTFLATLLHRDAASHAHPRLWWTLFFASTAAASLFGGIVHGFFHDPRTPQHTLLWTATLLCIGTAALSAYAMAAQLLLPPRAASALISTAILLLTLYIAAILFLTRKFWIAILAYLPALLFLAFALWRLHRHHPHPYLLLAISGVALTIIAAALQQLRIPLHPLYFDHNALYHVFQAISLYLIYLGGRHVLSAWKTINAT